MARRRFKDPEPELVGNWWQIRVYQDEYANGRRIRKRKRVWLAPASMPVREVQKLKAEYLRPLNQGLITPGSDTTFECFGRSVYIPTVLPLMASSTQSRYRGIMENYLIPAFGTKCLRDLSPLLLQKSCASDDLVFQSLFKGGPMRDNNILVRHIKPAAQLLGIPWAIGRCFGDPTRPGCEWSVQIPGTAKHSCDIPDLQRRRKSTSWAYRSHCAAQSISWEPW